MDNKAKIRKGMAFIRKGVEAAARRSLLEEMPMLLEQSLTLHAKLDAGKRRFHLEHEDTHGYAVAKGSEILSSGRNPGSPAEGKSAEEVAVAAATATSIPGLDFGPGAYKGTFVATMDYDFLNFTFEHNVQSILSRQAKTMMAKRFKEAATAQKL